MNKIILILALALLWNAQASAADRDCAKYTADQAIAATSEDSKNTFSATFSGLTVRQGTTNADCATTASTQSPSGGSSTGGQNTNSGSGTGSSTGGQGTQSGGGSGSANPSGGLGSPIVDETFGGGSGSANPSGGVGSPTLGGTGSTHTPGHSGGAYN